MNDAIRPLDYLAPPACIGILGAGQLGRMLVHTAQKMGYQTVVLDPDPNAPAAHLSHEFLQFAYDDPQGIALLAQRASRVTTEFENVQAHTLETLSLKVPVRPSAYAVSVAQDRAIEKNMIRACDLQTAPYHIIGQARDILKTPLELFPGILKTARLGYDGKGQVLVHDMAELHSAYASLNASSNPTAFDESIPCVFEKKLPLLAEFSVIVARNERNDMVNLPIQCNQHINGILHLCTVFNHALDAELENELMAHPLIREAAVIGVMHPRWSERPLACVVLEAGAVLSKEEILEFISAKVAKWQVPDDVVFIDEVPKTSVGKFSKKTLRERFENYQLPTA
jgi:5-(carboxyamino)imidazole ribonucleotide synthase